MAPPRLIPVDDREVARLLESGRTPDELAELWSEEYKAEVSAHWVRRAGRRGGYSPGQDGARVLPVAVTEPQAYAPAARALRSLHWRDTGQEDKLTDEARTQLRNWLRDRDETNTVAMYDEAMGPNPASPTYGGWYYAPRRPDTPAGEYFQHPLAEASA